MFFIILLAFLFTFGNAHAGLDNSHHDIRQHMPGKDACLICHDRKETNSYKKMEDELGKVGGKCVFLCHSGKGLLPETGTLVPVPGPSVNTTDYSTSQAPDYTAVFFTKSHGRDPANLKDGSGQPVTWPPPGVNWQGVSANRKMECTSCHSVHDSTYPPFLMAPLGSSGPNLDGLCDRCHAERATNNLSAPPDGTHPVDFPVDNAAASKRAKYGRHPRNILIQKYGRSDGGGTVNVFDVPNQVAASLKELGPSWDMGGHLTTGPAEAMTGWTGAGSTQRMGCYTCHSAHRSDVNGEKNLVVVKTADADNTWNPLCTGCHGSATTLDGDQAEWDVGRTGYGHPAGKNTAADAGGFYTTTQGGLRFRIGKVSFIQPQGANRFGPRGEIMCTTCHRVHYGQAGSMAIARLGQGTKSVCKSCHDGSGHPVATDGVEPVNSHHVTATKERAAELQNRGFGNPQWANTETGLGDIASGFDCADCHVFNGTAHNWN